MAKIISFNKHKLDRTYKKQMAGIKEIMQILLKCEKDLTPWKEGDIVGMFLDDIEQTKRMLMRDAKDIKDLFKKLQKEEERLNEEVCNNELDSQG